MSPFKGLAPEALFYQPWHTPCLSDLRMVVQQTIKKAVEVIGIGLHTGKRAVLVFKPAPENTGVYFIRKDLPGQPAVKAHSSNVRATNMATVLGGEGFSIHTVEHLMSAVVALGIDNLFIELHGPEIPIGDGSATSFFEALRSAGRVQQKLARKYIYVTKPVYYSQGDKHVYVTPASQTRLTCTIEFPHPQIGRQKVDLVVSENSFARELANARTFGFLKDVEALRQKGLALGGSLENAIVLDEREVLNPEGLRSPDEFVRHKAMDALGDLAMLGMPLLGHLVLHKAGHDVLHGFVEKLLEDPSNYRIIEIMDPYQQAVVQDEEAAEADYYLAALG